MPQITEKLVDTIRQQNLGAKLLDDGVLRYVVFLKPVKMRPIRRVERESIIKTVGRRAGSFDIVINANYYDYSHYTAAKAALGVAADVSQSKIEGRVIVGGKVVAGDSHPNRFYIAEVITTIRRHKNDPAWHYEVGYGDPPSGPRVISAIGNVGPLIDDRMPYGIGNKYRPPAKGPSRGNPPAGLRPSLTQRNNDTFVSAEERDSRTGKTIIAWNPIENALFVGVEADHDPDLKRPGVSYSRLVQLLNAAGFTEAVFCDGSDSAMLWHRGRMIIAPGVIKSNTMTLAIGFTQVHESAPAQKKTSK